MKLISDSIFAIAVTCVLAAAAIYAGLQVYGIRFYEVRSDSMAPAFSKGDVVGVKQLAPYQVKAGNVIAFQREGFPDPIIHRVTRIQSAPDIRATFKDPSGKVVGTRMTYSERTFWVKGDANPVEDKDTVSGQSVIGEQVLVVPFPFNLLVTKFERQTLMMIGVAAIALFIIWEAFDGLREVTRKKQEQAADARPQ